MPVRPPRPVDTPPEHDRAVGDVATRYADHALNCLQASGLRVTVPRRSVVELLSGSDTPLTASVMHAELQRRGTPVDQASIYRTLGLLEQHGLVHNVGDRGGYMRCENSPGAAGHLHLVCRRCNRVVALPLHQAPPGVHDASEAGFQVEHSRVELHGTCNDCGRVMD